MNPTISKLFQRYEPAIQWLQERLPPVQYAAILGSGINIAGQHDHTIQYRQIPAMPQPSVAGHQGMLHVYTRHEQTMLIWQGRFHLYEGYTLGEILAPVILSAALGCSVLLLTNAAGGLHPLFRPGDIMLIADQINFFPSRLVPPIAQHRGSPYDPQLRHQLYHQITGSTTALREGTYIGVSGPNYETPAEVRFYRFIGGDAIGMSTVTEAEWAVALGMRVAGCSIITNVLNSNVPSPVTHTEVLQVVRRAQDTIEQILQWLLTTRLPVSS